MEFCKSACLVLRTSRWNNIRRFDARVNMSLIDNGCRERASETECTSRAWKSVLLQEDGEVDVIET